MKPQELLKYAKLIDSFYSCSHYLSEHKHRLCPHYKSKCPCDEYKGAK